MLGKILTPLVVLACVLGVATAEELRGKLLEVDQDTGKIKFKSLDPEIKKLGPTKEFKVADKVKIFKTSQPDKSDRAEIPGGIKAEQLSDFPRQGVRAWIEVNKDNVVTEITLFARKLEGKKKKDKGKEKE
jgi:hypothetical protein